MRTHPPTLVTLVARALRDDIQLARGAHLLCATSGGPDSMALLDVLATLRRRLRFSLSAHGVDHGLRAEAKGELALARRWAEAHGVPFSVSRVAVPKGGNLQARAREARYAALRRAKTRLGADFVATAHHADDRAETVLIRLLHGANAAGLGVLPPRDGDLIRPMIRALRADVRAHADRHAIPSALDPSNDDPRYFRVRVRTEILPRLAALDPAIVAHLCALADELVGLREAGPAAYALPRASRLALAQLAREPAGGRRMVLLPGGIQATKAGAVPSRSRGREGPKKSSER